MTIPHNNQSLSYPFPIKEITYVSALGTEDQIRLNVFVSFSEEMSGYGSRYHIALGLISPPADKAIIYTRLFTLKREKIENEENLRYCSEFDLPVSDIKQEIKTLLDKVKSSSL